MSIPPKGEFDKFQSMMNPFGSVTFEHFEPDRKDIFEACNILDQEYRATGVRLDESYISKKIRKTLSARRLKNFSLFMPIVPNLIDVENPNYSRPPRRIFTINEEPISDADANILEQRYTEMEFNNEMLYISRQAGYMGTILAYPMVNEETDKMILVKLTPADPTLQVISDPFKMSDPVVVEYATENENGERVDNVWDLDEFVTVTHTASGQAIEQMDHGFDGMPISVLRYSTDSNRFWGPYDGGLLSLVQIRALLLADSIYRTQTSLYEFLVFAGFTEDAALAAVKTKSEGVMAYENDRDDSGKTVPNSKEISYVSPEGISPEKIFELWEKLYRQFLTARGHASKNFESSQMVQTAESMRMANISLIEIKEARRGQLLDFEQDLLERIIWANNSFGRSGTLSEDIEVNLDWQPDKQFFNNATDKSNYYTFSLNNNIVTPPDIIRQENPELSREEALEVYEKNKEFNEKNDVGFQQETDPNNLNPQDGEKDK